MFISLILAAIGWRCAVSFVKFAIVMDLRLIKQAEKLLSLDLAELTLALLQAALAGINLLNFHILEMNLLE